MPSYCWMFLNISLLHFTIGSKTFFLYFAPLIFILCDYCRCYSSLLTRENLSPFLMVSSLMAKLIQPSAVIKVTHYLNFCAIKTTFYFLKPWNVCCMLLTMVDPHELIVFCALQGRHICLEFRMWDCQPP